MRTWLTNRWIACYQSFWFVPGLFLLLGIALALVTPQVDRWVAVSLPAWIRTGETAARATLSALCGAMFTVTGVVFSTTCVALSITSSQLGPRLLRSFLSQQITQVTLGVCLATSVYCLILLRWIDKFDGAVFVPELSLLAASGLAIASLLLIVYFLHRVAHAMQAQSVASSVADDLDASIARLYPEEVGQPPKESDDPPDWQQAWDRFDEGETDTVEACSSGYVQAVDGDTLLHAADRLDAEFRLLKRPGDFLRVGDALLDIRPADVLDDSTTAELQRCFLTGSSRTNQQDIECSVNELVEIAVRALSPGVNDPFTAITCVDRLSGALCQLANRKIPSGLRANSDGELRVVIKPRAFGDVVDAAFDQVRQHAQGDVAVTLRLLEAAEAIGKRTHRDGDRRAVARQIELIGNAAKAADLAPDDLQKINERREQAEQPLAEDRS
ncbi:MAG: DUF2254 domain-containing protein [Planctomycetota bacterium]